MLSLIINIMNKYAKNKIPPVMGGAKAMIENLAYEERKIAQMNKASPIKVHSMYTEKEDISDIFTKYV